MSRGEPELLGDSGGVLLPEGNIEGNVLLAAVFVLAVPEAFNGPPPLGLLSNDFTCMIYMWINVNTYDSLININKTEPKILDSFEGKSNQIN